MENHYHLFLETPRGDLSRSMHLINLKYSGYFNLKHSHCGHTFQSRFQATLVQATEYAREVATYIHLNPVRAGLVGSPEDYEWSNYREYLGLTSPRPWTSSFAVLKMFGPSLFEARRGYQKHVHERQLRGLSDPLEGAKDSGILGNPDFMEHFKKPAVSGTIMRSDRSLSEVRGPVFRPTLKQIQTRTEAILCRDNRLSRKIAIYISHKSTDYTLKAIGEFFGMGESGISDVCRRTKKEIVHNGTLARIIEEIELRLRQECQREKEGTRSSQC
jgi:hypothetical protein